MISETSLKPSVDRQSPELQMVGSDERVSAADYWCAGSFLTVVSVAALCFFYSRNEILLSGDAVAHINIARRVFDSRTPGILQLGSVWLPLPHLLTIPFVVNTAMWKSGIGGSILSLVSYIAAGLGIFRLLSVWSRAAAWIGTIFFAANPNLLYVQTTALNEPIYLATFIWATVFFVEAWRSLRRNENGAVRWLERGALALTAAIFTRYDGWFLACVCWAAILPSVVNVLRRNGDRHLRTAVAKALLLTALGPALWLAYNFGVYGNALEFANGPYSANAIAQRTTRSGAPPYPGEDHPVTSATYFMKAAQLSIGEGASAKLLVFVAALASVAVVIRGEWMLVVLFWSPLVFYSLSIAYGSIPIFIPVWWPFSYYNTRYGLELLPAIAAGIGFSAFWIAETLWNRRARMASIAAVVLIAAVSYQNAAWRIPICLRETQTNGRVRMKVDSRLAEVLKTLPPQSTVLAYTGAHSGAFEMAAFPLRRTINEGNLHIWDASLAHPSTPTDYVVASEDDPIAQAVVRNPAGLQSIAVITVEDQPRTTVYRSLSPH